VELSVEHAGRRCCNLWLDQWNTKAFSVSSVFHLRGDRAEALQQTKVRLLRRVVERGFYYWACKS